MAVLNRYQLLDGQSYQGQECLNVYYYLQTAGTHTNADELIDAYLEFVLPDLLVVQNDAVTHELIAAKNLDVPTDFALRALTTANVGERTSEGLPPFVAYAFRYLRASTEVHNGAKRFVGVSEGDQHDGVVESGTLTALNTIADDLEATISVYTPVIMRKPLDENGVWTGEYIDFPISGVQYVRISSQNTRKFGRGS